MVGAIPGDVVMHERPVGRGYVASRGDAGVPVAVESAASRARCAPTNSTTRALENLGPDVRYAYASSAATASTASATASSSATCSRPIAHLRIDGGSDWAARFVEFVRRSDYRQRREGNIVYLDAMRGREALIV